ncbi:MAG: ATP-binding cassette domain-containing protein, partial [Armatimonadota bacterium]|nr:ATP-binding cassette domain-containing protein [Armatimonadota bacterium]
PLLRIDGATLVKGGVRILDDLSLEIAPGEHTAILGPNGSGKSSLIKLLTRQHYPLAGEDGKPKVTIFGRDRWDIFELRTLLGIVSADLHQTFVGDGDLRGLEVVLSGFFASQGLARHHAVTPAQRERAQEALRLVEATHLAEKPMAQMSTGEARRVLIARALVPDPRALLLDEPTTGLDLIARRRFLETLRRIAGQGKTILLVTHHVEEILPEMGRVILMQSGKVFRDGSKQNVLTSANLTALYHASVEVTEHDGWYAAHSRFP